MKLASRLAEVRVSPTVAISTRARELKAEGRDIIALAAGEPDFETPQHIRDAAKRAIDRGETRYTATEGIPELREAIAAKFKRDNGLDYTPDQVLVGVGGKQVIFNVMMATLDADDEVIIPAPYWVSYPDIVRLFGGKPVFVNTKPEEGFRLTPEALEQAITPRTRWLLLNSPSNPTGVMYSSVDLSGLGAVLKRHPQVLVLTDDIYEMLTYGTVEFQTFASVVPELHERTLTMNGVSKSYAMTGWRIGYGAGPKPLMAAMKKIQGQSTYHPCTIAQWAAVEALNGPQDVLETMLSTFTRRRKQTLDALNATEGINCVSPDGAFYIFPSIQAHLGRRAPNGTVLQEDSDWVLALMEDQGVAVVPGSAFGAPGYFRLSFAAADDLLAEATRRIRNFVERLD